MAADRVYEFLAAAGVGKDRALEESELVMLESTDPSEQAFHLARRVEGTIAFVDDKVGRETVNSKAAAADRITGPAVETAFATAPELAPEQLTEGTIVDWEALLLLISADAADTLVLKTYLGAVELFTDVAWDPTDGGGDIVRLSGSFRVRTAGATGKIDGGGSEVRSVVGTVTRVDGVPFINAAIDLSEALEFTVSATFSTVDADNKIDLRSLHLTVRKP